MIGLSKRFYLNGHTIEFVHKLKSYNLPDREGSNPEMIPGVASVILNGSQQGGYFF